MVRDMLKGAVERGEIRAKVDLEATERIIHALTITVGDSQLPPQLNTYFQVSDNRVCRLPTTGQGGADYRRCGSVPWPSNRRATWST